LKIIRLKLLIWLTSGI